jgi:hypothetical protein
MMSCAAIVARRVKAIMAKTLAIESASATGFQDQEAVPMQGAASQRLGQLHALAPDEERQEQDQQATGCLTETAACSSFKSLQRPLEWV